jgi:hypothetical protein
MPGRGDALGGAGVVLEAGMREGLVDATVRQQLDVAVATRRLEPGRVVERDAKEEDEQATKSNLGLVIVMTYTHEVLTYAL